MDRDEIEIGIRPGGPEQGRPMDLDRERRDGSQHGLPQVGTRASFGIGSSVGLSFVRDGGEQEKDRPEISDPVFSMIFRRIATIFVSKGSMRGRWYFVRPHRSM